MRFYLIGILALLFTLPVEADIYRWVDSNGEVHFSDQPRTGAEKLNLPSAQTYSPPQATTGNENSNTNTNNDAKKAPFTYKLVKIIQPQADETLRNNQGMVSVAVELEPGLRKSDKVQLVFDGKDIGNPENSTVITLTNVLRGSHTVAVNVLSSEGNVISTSDSVTFFMHRPRVNMVHRVGNAHGQ